jgi:hypothetical protein
MAFIIMMLTRLCGYDGGHIVPKNDSFDANLYFVIVVYGYVLILLLQIIGGLGGDRAPVMVRQYTVRDCRMTDYRFNLYNS